MTSYSWIPRSALVVAAVTAALYSSALIAFTSPSIQRHALYAHLVCSPSWWMDVNKPEQLGFAPNQVSPFTIRTEDGESLYAWHILPVGLYIKHEKDLISQPTGFKENIALSTPFDLLSNDAEARVIISFHGNAGNVAQGWRPELYRALCGGSTSNVHVLAIDYRGFGLSSGSPTEDGLILDGLAAVKWVLNVARIPSERIAVIGHSLGTAVSIAVAERLAIRGVELSGVVLVAGFSDVTSLLTSYPSYSIGGYIPVGPLLAPLRPSVQFADKWPSTTRLENYVRVSKRVRLHFVHAKDDWEIPWVNTEKLFAAAASATFDGSLSPDQVSQRKAEKTILLQDGAFESYWNTGDDKIITEHIVSYGGHNKVMTYVPAAVAVAKALGLS